MWRFALLVAFLGLVLPSPAHACKCLRTKEVFPPSGTVPPNAAFFVREPNSKVLLFDETDTSVPLEVEPTDGPWMRFRPASPLEVGKRYTLKPDPQDEWTQSTDSLGSYEVQGAPDTQSPSPPTQSHFEYVHAENHTTCPGTKDGYSVSFSGTSDDQATGEQLAVAVVSASAPHQMLGMLTPKGRKYLGSDICFHNFNVRSAQGKSLALRAVDLAGNLSAPGAAFTLPPSTPSAPEEPEQPEQPEQILPPRLLIGLAALVLGFAGVGLFFARRSRRQGKPSA